MGPFQRKCTREAKVLFKSPLRLRLGSAVLSLPPFPSPAPAMPSEERLRRQAVLDSMKRRMAAPATIMATWSIQTLRSRGAKMVTRLGHRERPDRRDNVSVNEAGQMVPVSREMVTRLGSQRACGSGGSVREEEPGGGEGE